MRAVFVRTRALGVANDRGPAGRALTRVDGVVAGVAGALESVEDLAVHSGARSALPALAIAGPTVSADHGAANGPHEVVRHDWQPSARGTTRGECVRATVAARRRVSGRTGSTSVGVGLDAAA
jgi:hypothetical protein